MINQTDLTKFSKAMDKIRDLFEKEVDKLLSDNSNIDVIKTLYKSALYGRLIDYNYITSPKFENIMHNLLNLVCDLKRDEVFTALVLFSKVILDILSTIEVTENQTKKVDVYNMFLKVMDILNPNYEIPNLSTVETTCILCGKTMQIEKGWEDFANICKTCRGE